MLRLCLLVIGFIIVKTAYSQTPADFTRRFEQAQSAEAFLLSFDSMIHQFHSGRLHFEHDEVKIIIDIAQQKSFANDLLPGVFGWARTMFANGRVREGLTFFMESADRYQRSGNTIGEAISYYEIAIIQHKAENLAEAEKYYRLAFDRGKDLLPYRSTINCLNGLAMILRSQRRSNLAATEFRRAMNVAVAHKDTAWIGILAGNIGSCHFLQNNYDSSLWYYNQNLFFIRRTGEFENHIETYTNLARVYLRKNQLKLSKLYLDSAVAFIQTRKINFNDFFNPMEQINQSYAMLYSAMGDYENAYHHFVKYHDIAEQRQQNINSRGLKQLESVWQFDKNQNEIILLKKINQQQRYISWAFGLLILLLAVVSFYAFRRARRRKKINRQLSAANSELGRLNEVKDLLVSVISHDLRGPIANLRSTLDLLRRENLKPEELSMLAERLGTQLEVSGGALENILQWAKAQLNEMAAKPTRIKIGQLVASVVAQVNVDAANKRIEIVNEVDHDVSVYADKDQLEVVVRNLITNAIKFTAPGGSIRICVEKGDGLINLTVHDTGVGMTREQLESLFKPNRESTDGTNKEKGTGIGLIISKEMIVANGGTLWAESEPGNGSKFHVTIPSRLKII